MIKYIASIFIAAAMLLSSGIALADANGSVAANKWLRKAPTDGCDDACAATLSASTDRIKRNQTLYFTVIDDGGQDHTIQAGSKEDCTVGHASTGCSSSPLFVASDSLTICMDGDLEDGTAGSGVVTMYICSTSACTRATSVTGYGALGAADECTEFGNGTDQYNSFSIGNSWVYVDVSTTPASGETLLVWITAN
tara:strand:- start:684 stop:1268 length:585 start_codon:yes stop_codon:yes gene_type:complete